MEIHIPQVAQTGADTQSEPQIYTVQPGDSILSIAGMFDLSVESLSLANPELLTGNLHPGQELKIPLGEGLTGFIVYVVQTNDTLDTLAQKFELASMDLLRANPQLVKNPLVPGSQIRIPQFEKPIEKSEQTAAKKSERFTERSNQNLSQESKASEKETKPNTDRSYDYALDNISKARLQMSELPVPGFGLQQAYEREPEAAGSEQRQSQKGRAIPPPFDEWAELLERASITYDLPASLLAAVIWRESGGRNIRQNDRYGLFQFEASRHAEWLRAHDYGMKPESSIDYAAALIKSYRDRYKGNMRLALAAFHSGIEIVDGHLQGRLLAETSEPIRFAFDVLAQQEYFRRFFDE